MGAPPWSWVGDVGVRRDLSSKSSATSCGADVWHEDVRHSFPLAVLKVSPVRAQRTIKAHPGNGVKKKDLRHRGTGW